MNRRSFFKGIAAGALLALGKRYPLATTNLEVAERGPDGDWRLISVEPTGGVVSADALPARSE